MKLMFICTGNICRSAMAHVMLEEQTKKMNKKIKIYSCGVYAEEGVRSTEQAIKVMKEYNIDLTRHRATHIRKSDIENMDLILCATTAHKNHVTSLYPKLKDRVYTMKEYAGYSKNDLDIKDPWGYNLETYKRCAEEINECLKKIMEKI